jgi:hypothetical protein
MGGNIYNFYGVLCIPAFEWWSTRSDKVLDVLLYKKHNAAVEFLPMSDDRQTGLLQQNTPNSKR